MTIFWRIFIAFWLASSAILFMTAFVVVHKIEGNRLIESHSERVAVIAQALIAQYENKEVLPRNPNRALKHRHKQNLPGHEVKNHYPPFPLNIDIRLQRDGRSIYSHRANKLSSAPTIYFDLKGDSGATYQVVANRPILPYIFREIFARVFSLQFISILLVSTVVSAVLSWNITRPLKKLGYYSRLFSEKKNVEIDQKILGRSDELGELSRDLQDMANVITATLEAQHQLLHDVSHELRAPLARLQARIALSEKSGLPPEQVESMHKECERLSALIQQILNYSRLSQDFEQMEVDNIKSLIEDVVTAIQVEFPRRDIRLQIEKGEGARLAVFSASLHSALENIVRNACFHTPENTPIEIEITETSDEVTIRVRDYGNGLREDELEKVLQPFYRGGNNMHAEGFGLGLSIAQKVFHKHKGSVRLENVSDGGLLVECCLPKDIG